MTRDWQYEYDVLADAELTCIHARIEGGDRDILRRIEAYLHDEKVACIPWPPQVMGMPVIKSRGVNADVVSRF